MRMWERVHWEVVYQCVRGYLTCWEKELGSEASEIPTLPQSGSTVIYQQPPPPPPRMQMLNIHAVAIEKEQLATQRCLVRHCGFSVGQAGG
ncbi:hypothetical protein FGO68_gene11912 [Halteria grandinella]|uniref:Uncharacterized protein n=1 Tax=Halteria grandinella TaxID=5974 RepID=A0A8J8SZM3_HALGN|nr:hypothetical protein FGO68_gene11912 [Halteria grandinella]